MGKAAAQQRVDRFLMVFSSAVRPRSFAAKKAVDGIVHRRDARKRFVPRSFGIPLFIEDVF